MMFSANFFKERINFYSSLNNQKIFLKDEANKLLSYGHLKNHLDHLSQFYNSEKLGRHSVVLVWLPPGIEQCTYAVSLLYNNIPALVLSANFKLSDIVKVLNQYPIAALLTLHSSAIKLQSLLDLNSFEFTEVKSVTNEDMLTMLFKKNRPDVDIQFSWLLHTSGSTGEPKAVMLSDENLVKRTEGEINLFTLKEYSYLLNLLPISHDLGLNQLLTALSTGSTLEIFAKKMPVDFAQRMFQTQLTGITGMPSIWNKFISIASRMNMEMDYSGYITVSGGSMTADNLLKLKNIFKNAKIYKTYGQTETFRTFAETDQANILSSSCGKALDGVQVLLLNEKSDPCSINEIGELIHFGDGIMTGYWLDESSTKKKIKHFPPRHSGDLTSGMGICTGDYFKVLPNNEFQFIGRQDDLIKRSGHRFYISEIEDCMLNSDLIQSVCVMCVDDLNNEMQNEKMIAFVIPKNKIFFVQKKLLEYCLTKLQTFKVPNEIIVLTSFPMTSSHKIDRQALVRLSRRSRLELEDPLE